MDIEEIHSNTEIIMDFKTPLTSMDRSCRQKINKDTVTLNDTLDQMDSISSAEYIFFSSTHGTVYRTDQI